MFIVVYTEDGAPNDQMLDEEIKRLYQIGSQKELEDYVERRRLIALSDESSLLNHCQISALSEFLQCDLLTPPKVYHISSVVYK